MDTDSTLTVRATNGAITVDHRHEFGRDRLILSEADARALIARLTATLDAIPATD